jgi:hypothetical protein
MLLSQVILVALLSELSLLLLRLVRSGRSSELLVGKNRRRKLRLIGRLV